MMGAAQGLHAFLRAYYHHKSADWAANQPFRLRDWSAAEMAKLPTYYVMDRAQTMPETVAPAMPSAAEIARCTWLTEQTWPAGCQYRFSGRAELLPHPICPGTERGSGHFPPGARSTSPPSSSPGHRIGACTGAPARSAVQGTACTRIRGCAYWYRRGALGAAKSPPARTVDLLEGLLGQPI